MWVWSLPGSGRSPGEGNDTHSSILAWEISWTKEPVHGATVRGVAKESDTTEQLMKNKVAPTTAEGTGLIQWRGMPTPQPAGSPGRTLGRVHGPRQGAGADWVHFYPICLQLPNRGEYSPASPQGFWLQLQPLLYKWVPHVIWKYYLAAGMVM